MTGPTHVLIGMGATIGFVHATGLRPDGLGLLGVILGSLAPDIDGGGSVTKLGTIFRPFLGWRAAKALDIYSEALARAISCTLGHRGFMHSPLLAVAILVGALWFDVEWFFWFGWGYAWHLVGDIITPAGIPVLSPFSSRKRSVGRVRVGSKGEAVLATTLVVLVCAAGWPLLPEPVKETHVELWRIVTQ